MVAVFSIAVRTFELLHSFHFIRGLTAKHTPGVIVQPLLHLCDLLRGYVFKVATFWKPTAQHTVLVFITSTFAGVVRVTIIYNRPGRVLCYRLFKGLLIEKFRAVVARDRLEDFTEAVSTIRAFQIIKCTCNSFLRLVRHFHNYFIPGLAFCKN